MDVQSIMSTFGNFDWLNDGLGLVDGPVLEEAAAASPPPSKRAKTSGTAVAEAALTVSVPAASASRAHSTPRQGAGTRERASSSSSSNGSKSRNPTHRRRGRKGKSIYRGVCVTREGKWRAVIYKERKQLYLGVFESEIDAAKAHDRAARQHFGEQAMVNFLEPQDSESQAHIPVHVAAAAAAAAAAHVVPAQPGNISPVSATSKVAKSAVSAVKEEGSAVKAAAPSALNQMNFLNGPLDFAFPFDEEDSVYDGGADSLGLMTYDMEVFAADAAPIMDAAAAHEPFGCSLSFLGGGVADAGELCLV